MNSPAWVLVPLAGSVLLLVPAFGASLALTGVALAVWLLLDPAAPRRRLLLYLILGWLLLQLAVAVVGFGLWGGFEGAETLPPRT